MEKPIKILHVLGALNRGGAETMIMNIFRYIDRTKIQFDFIIHTHKKCDYDDEIARLGGSIFNMPRYTGKNHFEYCEAWKAFFENYREFKIVHGHMRSTAAIYLSIAKKYGLITIAHSHSTASRGNIIEQLTKNIMQFPIRYTADYLFACSNEAGKWLFGEKAITKNNYKVIRNAVDVNKYTFNENRRNEVRKELGIQGKFVIGHVGNFTYPKNHKFLLDVFYEVRNKNQNSILLLVGDGELKKQLKEKIDGMGIQDKVLLTGVVPNVEDYMQAMDIFVFPSLFEGFGLAVLEAQALGLRSIVSDVVPKDIFITDLVESLSLRDKITDWADKILQYNKSYERRNNCREIRCRNYDIKENVTILERLYLEMLEDAIDG